MERATYLARVPSEMYERRYERFPINRPGEIAYLESGLGGLRKIGVKVLDMSQGGAGLELPLSIKLPQHYYLSVFGFPNRFGCAEVHRNGTRIGVKFLGNIDGELLSSIVRADFRAGAVNLRR
ncbi:PilZ domain-containing protein [Rhizobium sp. L1K21]|uniref:PilZ domain-containing protein n=1 Tax=Rhizobium sp. L1K21 TaxID=2954933 RepID=UPI0020920A4C|nr:PilZ domain-containing protein [Rhizobium sp. L1K21]MCO6186636.1 PilZ domain-containing protein [Rhizobium sp. L1K21]